MGYIIRRMQDRDIPQALEIDREAFPTQWPHPTYASFKQELRNRLACYIVVTKPSESEMTEQSPGNRKFWQKLLHLFDHDRFFGAEIPTPKEYIVGIAGFWVMVDEAHITTLAVRDSYRRQGVGERLLSEIIEMAVANEFAHICRLYDADPYSVFKLVTEGDPHRKLKSPGIWAGKKPGVWGGFCLPKDTTMLVGTLAIDRGYTPQLPEAAERIRVETIKRKADEIYYNTKGGTIGIIGITNKPISEGIPDARNSPVIDVIQLLVQKGANVKIYDPNLPREDLLELANNLGVSVASQEEVEKCEIVAVYENYDLQLRKT